MEPKTAEPKPKVEQKWNNIITKTVLSINQQAVCQNR